MHAGSMRLKRLAAWLCGALLCAVLCATYYLNPLDRGNEVFADFQMDSEELVLSSLLLAQKKEPLPGFGLCNVSSATARGRELYAWQAYTPVTDALYDQGLSRSEPVVAFPRTWYCTAMLLPGRSLRLLGGETRKITDAQAIGNYWFVRLEGDAALDPRRDGTPNQMTLLLENGEEAPDWYVSPYLSQLGLQGAIAYAVGRVIPSPAQYLRFLNALLTAAVLAAIVMLCGKRYGFAAGLSFGVVFWLSQWTVNFARNLYWVEWTWFLPMLVGLLSVCFPRRFWWSAAAFVTIAVKCACGYEFISCIMLGLVFFPCVELLRGKKGAFRRTLWLGISALLGFAAVLLLHGAARGEGNLMQGLTSIYRQDVLRRTMATDPTLISEYQYAASTSESIAASVGMVLRRYTKFETPVLLGLPAWTFPAVALLPVACFVMEAFRRRLDRAALGMWMMGLVCALSWLILGKSHAYEHPQLSYVVWYFGFVQACLYAALHFVQGAIRK